MRIMLDTNIIVSGLAFAGNERELLNVIYNHNATLVLSEYVVLETKAVLTRKFPGKERLLDHIINLVQVEIAAMPLKEKVNEAELIIRDQKNAVVLAAAIEVKPDIFVSGELDFHTSKITSTINVMHPKEAIALINYHNSHN